MLGVRRTAPAGSFFSAARVRVSRAVEPEGAGGCGRGGLVAGRVTAHAHAEPRGGAAGGAARDPGGTYIYMLSLSFALSIHNKHK